MTLTEDFVLFGTPLDPLDDDEGLRKKPIPIEQQVATDDHGRRRFHGAFTGGFSAGFFNTVGSKEGWIPSEFLSSRSTKADGHKQKPEDYMDDEDMGEFGFAPQKLKTSSKFHNDPKNQKKPENGDNSFLSNALMENVFKASKETVGHELLIRMGWRPGKGIGPRLTKLDRKRKMASHNKLFQGKSTDENGEMNKDEENEFTEKYKDFLFAPDELPIEMVNPKENHQGIGYKGLEKTSVLGNLPISTGHFNLFDIGPEKSATSSAKNRPKNMKIRGQAFGVGAYEEDDEDIYGKDDMSNYDFSLPTEQEERRQNRPKRESRWDPGPSTDVIEGFELDLSDVASILLKKSYPPPIVPKGWQPKLGRKTSRFDVVKPSNTNPTPSQRRELVTDAEADKPKPPAPSTTMEQLNDLLAEKSEIPDSSFKPFISNPEKQSRYEKYLVCVKNNRGDALRLLQPKMMTEWERDRERVEFERAAILYQPLNTAMSSRFVSAGLSQDADAVKKEEVPDDDVKRAVSMKLFGKLTRERVEWHPAKLLCVRFNVKQPYPGDTIGVPLNQRTKFDIFGRLERDENSSRSAQPEPERGVEPMAIDMKGDAQAMEIKEEDVDESDQSRPPLDLFKSIFANSDSDESEPEEEQPQSKPPPTEPTAVTASAPTPSVPPKKIATGLFANIDFDKLNQRASTTAPPPPAEKPKPPEKVNDTPRGPALPPKAPEIKQPDVDFEWVEKGPDIEAKSKKRKKKKDSKGLEKSSEDSSDDRRSKKKSLKRRYSSDEDEKSKKKSSHKKKKRYSRDRSLETTSKRSKSKSSKQKKKNKAKKREDDSSD